MVYTTYCCSAQNTSFSHDGQNRLTISDSQVMTKNKTFLLNHSLVCASYAIYLAIHTCNINIATPLQ